MCAAGRSPRLRSESDRQGDRRKMWNKPGEKESHEIERQGGMARLFGQMMLLPFVTFVYALESFARALREIQHTGVRTLDAFTGREDDFDHAVAPRDGYAPRNRGEPASSVGGTDYRALDVIDQSIRTSVQPTETEGREMTELDLRGDDLKLVHYTIVFTKRDVEEALDFGIDLINYTTTEGDYKSTRKDEYIRKVLKSGEGFKRPDEWVTEKYPEAKYIENRGGVEYVIGLPEEDRNKYLRVFVEVVARYEKEERPYKKVKVINYP